MAVPLSPRNTMEAERSTKGQGQGHEIVIDCNSAANGPIFKYTDQIVQISPADMPAVFRLHGRYFLFHFCSHLYTLNQIARAAVYEFSKIYGKLYLLSSYIPSAVFRFHLHYTHRRILPSRYFNDALCIIGLPSLL